MLNTQSETFLKNETERAIASFCPFNYLDIKRAVQVAIEVGENSDWAVEQIEQFRDECFEGKFEHESGYKIDPVHVIYDSILQSARNQIEKLTNYDFMNDYKGSGGIDTYGNYICTSFDYSEGAKTELEKILKKKKIKASDLDKKTAWFLDELEIQL